MRVGTHAYHAQVFRMEQYLQAVFKSADVEMLRSSGGAGSGVGAGRHGNSGVGSLEMQKHFTLDFLRVLVAAVRKLIDSVRSCGTAPEPAWRATLHDVATMLGRPVTEQQGKATAAGARGVDSRPGTANRFEVFGLPSIVAFAELAAASSSSSYSLSSSSSSSSSSVAATHNTVSERRGTIAPAFGATAVETAQHLFGAGNNEDDRAPNSSASDSIGLLRQTTRNDPSHGGGHRDPSTANKEVGAHRVAASDDDALAVVAGTVGNQKPAIFVSPSEREATFARKIDSSGWSQQRDNRQTPRPLVAEWVKRATKHADMRIDCVDAHQVRMYVCMCVYVCVCTCCVHANVFLCACSACCFLLLFFASSTGATLVFSLLLLLLFDNC